MKQYENNMTVNGEDILKIWNYGYNLLCGNEIVKIKKGVKKRGGFPFFY